MPGGLHQRQQLALHQYGGGIAVLQLVADFAFLVRGVHGGKDETQHASRHPGNPVFRAIGHEQTEGIAFTQAKIVESRGCRARERIELAVGEGDVSPVNGRALRHPKRGPRQHLMEHDIRIDERWTVKFPETVRRWWNIWCNIRNGFVHSGAPSSLAARRLVGGLLQISTLSLSEGLSSVKFHHSLMSLGRL